MVTSANIPGMYHISGSIVLAIFLRHLWLNILVNCVICWLIWLGSTHQGRLHVETMEIGNMPSKLQHFLLSILQSKSRQLYTNALNDFRAEIEARHVDWAHFGEEDRDIFLAEYVLEVKEGGGKRQACQILCAALHKIYPRHAYVTTRKVLEVWKAEEPTHQAPACPPEVAYALVSCSLAMGQPGVAACILLCFTGLLRVSEALHLRWQDMVFVEQVVVLILAKTKRGVDQKVVLTHPSTVEWLRLYRARHFTKDPEFICPLSYSKIRYWLPKLCKGLHLEQLALTSHSFRRGGASTLLHQGVALADIAVHGRWASDTSCREYLRRGEMFLLRFQSSVESAVWANVLLLSKSTMVLLSAK